MQPSPSTDIRFESLQTEGSESSNNEDEGDYGNSNSYHPKVRTTKIILAEGLRHALFDWKIVVFGQLLSFLLACGGAAQATLALDCSLSAPSFAIGLYYFVLSFCLIPVYLKGRRQRQRQGMVTVVANEDDYHDGSNHDGNNTNTNTRTHESSTAPYSFFLGNIPLNAPAWGYMILSVMDVYANYFTVLAFKYTTITSVTVFDALAIPSAMFLSRCFLSRQYSWVHLAGVASCMAGILFNVLQDYEDDNNNDNDNIDQAYPHKLRGDLLAITGGLLFGANNVLGEGKFLLLLHYRCIDQCYYVRTLTHTHTHTHMFFLVSKSRCEITARLMSILACWGSLRPLFV
jgi:drug/metabolite transporter (DMT)-like permease